MASSRDREGLTHGTTSSTKKAASLQGLIAKGKTLKRPREGDDDNDKYAIRLEPRRSKDNKETSPINARDFFAKYKRADSNPRPNYLAEATRLYHTAAASTIDSHLQPTLTTLLSRMNGLDATGAPLPNHDVPTQASFAALFAEDAALSRPIEDQMLRIEYSDSSPSSSPSGETTTIKDVRWGDTWEKFQRHYAQKREELAECQGEMEVVVREMRSLEDEIVAGDGEMKRAVEKFEGEMEGFRKQVEEVERAARDEAEAVEREEREKGRVFRKELEEFLRNALGE